MAINLITQPTGGAPLSTNDYNYQNVDIGILINSLVNKQLHLTEWDTLTVPALARYVYINHGGAFFQVQDSDYAITGAPAAGRVYIKVERSGDILTAEFVNSAVGYSWNYVYNGFYHADGTQLLPYVLYKTATGYHKYTLKNSEDKFDITAFIIVEGIEAIGVWNMDTTATVTIAYNDILTLLDSDLAFDDFASRVFVISSGIIDDVQKSSVIISVGGNVALSNTLTAIRLERDAGGHFDNNSFDDGVINRGYVYYAIRL